MKRPSKRKYWQLKGRMQRNQPMSICYFDRQLQEFADESSGTPSKACSTIQRSVRIYTTELGKKSYQTVGSFGNFVTLPPSSENAQK
jgi:hypothetical protein